MEFKKQVIFFGLASGTIFTVIETYFYVSSASLDVSVIYQLFSRFFASVHVLTTTIAVLGIYTFVQMREISDKTIKTNFKLISTRFLPYFVIAWTIHSLWNAHIRIISYFVYTFYYNSQNIGHISDDLIFITQLSFGIFINLSLFLIIFRKERN